jgi:hypothetical protein
MCVTRSRSIASRITPGRPTAAITLRAPMRASATIVAPAAWRERRNDQVHRVLARRRELVGDR